MRIARKSGPTLKPAALRAKAIAAGKVRENLKITVFALSAALPAAELAVFLEGQLAQLTLNSQVRVAGPERVKAALAGRFNEADVLVVVGDGSATAEPALMELVQWLLLNGRTALAENLVYVQLGARTSATPAPVFERVVLPMNFAEQTQQSGRRLPWAAASHESWELADAVLNYATGLSAE
ncbi:hypothetical protein ACT3TP_03405 [Glutamicibacter sp. AOP38-B1-38]|uniref:hypothetical protein n=1 Tax=unclassified Glutamicibacter TaxID=2627139 RepID=UPI004033A296